MPKAKSKQGQKPKPKSKRQYYSTKGAKGVLGKFYRLYCAYAGKDLHECERKGECKRCGECCKLPVRCIFFYNKRCLIYNHRFKPCRVYPARKSDLDNMDCGFYFE